MYVIHQSQHSLPDSITILLPTLIHDGEECSRQTAHTISAQFIHSEFALWIICIHAGMGQNTYVLTAYSSFLIDILLYISKVNAPYFFCYSKNTLVICAYTVDGCTACVHSANYTQKVHANMPNIKKIIGLQCKGFLLK